MISDPSSTYSSLNLFDRLSTFPTYTRKNLSSAISYLGTRYSSTRCLMIISGERFSL